MNEPKQVIIVRKDLGMRKGKMIAQGAHASLQAILQEAMPAENPNGEHLLMVEITPTTKEWLSGSHAKVVLGVDSEKELLNLYEKAQGLPRALIQDEGRTEFGGVPTYTACAIGPAPSEEIDKITGHLQLL